MSRKDRAAALTQRRNAVAIIRNVRKTRRLLAKFPFDEKTFNAINGKERGLESLVGKDILFPCLDESQRLSLRHEINTKLNEAEVTAFESLRASTVAFFADLQKIIDRATLVFNTKAAQDLMAKKQVAVEAFNAFEMSKGALDCERCLSTLEHLELVAEDVEETVPGFEHELDKEEYTEEQHEDEDELPEDGPDGDDDDEDDDEDDDTDEDIDLDDDPNDYPDRDQADENGEGAPLPEGDDKEEISDLSFICDEENFATLVPQFMLPTEVCTEGAGFNQERGFKILTAYDKTMRKYCAALTKLRDVIAPETCTMENLLHGKVKLYRKMDKIISLIEKFEPLREALDKSCEGLLNASKVVLQKEIIDPKL